MDVPYSPPMFRHGAPLGGYVGLSYGSLSPLGQSSCCVFLSLEQARSGFRRQHHGQHRAPSGGIYNYNLHKLSSLAVFRKKSWRRSPASHRPVTVHLAPLLESDQSHCLLNTVHGPLGGGIVVGQTRAGNWPMSFVSILPASVPEYCWSAFWSFRTDRIETREPIARRQELSLGGGHWRRKIQGAGRRGGLQGNETSAELT